MTSASIDCDDAWEAYNNNSFKEDLVLEDEVDSMTTNSDFLPKCSEIYISTKTKISYLNKPIDLQRVFWDIKIMPYHHAGEGVIKKQMKYSFKTKEEAKHVDDMLSNESYYEQQSLIKIDNPEGQVKFKDVRKISVGICSKDILSYRCKKKSAFYNCFVLIMRVKYNNRYKECHVKVFNTGKLELPGIQTEDFLHLILNNLVKILNTNCNLNIDYTRDKNETVLINSNFTTNYYIDREMLVDILKSKYNINTTYDPCSYPGIMSKFYYNKLAKIQTGIEPAIKDSSISEVSFMIFRTGSVLIVGKCEEDALVEIYEYLKEILITECIYIRQQSTLETKKKGVVKKKVRRKTITLY